MKVFLFFCSAICITIYLVSFLCPRSSIAYFLLSFVLCSLFSVSSPMSSIVCLLSLVLCFLFTVNCSLSSFPVISPLFSILGPKLSILCPMFSAIHSPLLSVFCLQSPGLSSQFIILYLLSSVLYSRSSIPFSIVCLCSLFFLLLGLKPLVSYPLSVFFDLWFPALYPLSSIACVLSLVLVPSYVLY